MNSMNLVSGPALEPWGYNDAGMTPAITETYQTHHPDNQGPQEISCIFLKM